MLLEFRILPIKVLPHCLLHVYKVGIMKLDIFVQITFIGICHFNTWSAYLLKQRLLFPVFATIDLPQIVQTSMAVSPRLSLLEPLANWNRIISLACSIFTRKACTHLYFNSRIWGSDSHFAKINSMILKINRNKKPHKSAADTLSGNITLLC